MKKLILLFTLAFIMVAAPGLAQDMPAYPSDLTECEVDLTGETLTLYHFGDLSGTYAFITQPIVSALADGIAYWNGRGGVCGAELQQIYEDTGGNLEAAQSAYDRFTSEHGESLDLLLLYSSSDGELLREQLAEDEIVGLIAAGSIESLYGEDGQTPGWLFATNPLYINQFGSFCEFVAANPETFPDPVIGHVTWPTAFGLSGTEPAADAYCTGLGVEVLDEPQTFLPTDTDILTQVQNAIDAGATIIYTNTLATGPALIASTLVDLGMEGEIALAGVNWVMDTSVGLLGQRSLGAKGLPSVNGMYGSMPFRWWTEAGEASIQFVTMQHAANQRSPVEQNIAYLVTWGMLDTVVELHIRAVNEAGSLAAVEGAGLRAAIENIDYEALGGLYRFAYPDGMRDTSENRIARMAYANADMSGPATSPADALLIDPGDGSRMFVPIIIPLTGFETVPNLRAGE